MKVAVIQHSCTQNKSENLAYISDQMAALEGQGIELVVLQELHASLYFCQTAELRFFDLAEPLQGPTTQHLSQLAAQYGCVIVGSIFEKRMEGVYHNTAVVLDSDGGFAGYYRKMHIPDDPGFYEKFYFTPGDHSADAQSFKPIDTTIGKIGVLVCWDQWYPEAARLMALAGAKLLVYPTAIGWDPDDSPDEQTRQRNAWQIIQQSHAIANHLPVIVTNRVGFEPDPSGQTSGIQFWGGSFIAGQQGDILALAPTDTPYTLQATLNFERTTTLRQLWPYFRDRRIDAYVPLLNRCNSETEQ